MLSYVYGLKLHSEGLVVANYCPDENGGNDRSDRRVERDVLHSSSFPIRDGQPRKDIGRGTPKYLENVF